MSSQGRIVRYKPGKGWRAINLDGLFWFLHFSINADLELTLLPPEPLEDSVWRFSVELELSLMYRAS